ncbi:MAG: MBL fold metallo-hydrolase [Bacteroidetes bacterium]|nr:MBL fold metallo-hydrolase [Bacteroidota bacterium]
MSLYIASLNSGSNGNCYYIGNDREGVFVDAGIPCAEIEKRMDRLGIGMERVKAVFVSHEHTDHILGIPVLVKKYKLPVYITSDTYREAKIHFDKKLLYTFKAHDPVQVGNLSITGFPKLHDAIDPHSFTITDNDVTVGVFTDIGKPCEHVIHYFKKCHAAFLESNYDEERLANGRYPFFLKNRIRSDKGHLSNVQAFELFIEHRPGFMTHLLLSHLSKENNRPEIAERVFSADAGNTKIVLASRNNETALFHIEKNNLPATAQRKFVRNQKLVQLTLFES